ncbi:flavin reductase family protein [Alicyclobacillus vulcanalis]|uniref:NADH-FMN oxidoreductase RutF, flavin reductase (DIM6/NTAB) family n=1 Tax=Alicyclobacillus vulcanalis TaxID=252246 RepID=A0A1N7N4F9_9BACL|nr:flavin reductase family protein [Alicyclobacillus vulcanalis]SIS93252.1 NADH-FMN oxidoreductase RutF, flavin reductase (DIM6/NTAB) family [Alicyclobacillus vulcanalis]
MLSLNPNEMTPLECYKFLIGAVIPRPIAFVTTLSKAGVLNAAPFSFFNVVTPAPPMVSVSVQRQNGQPKDTARNAVDSGAFVVHIVSEPYTEKINQTAATLPPDESEVALAGLTPVPSEAIEVPGVLEARVRMECVLEHALPLGGTRQAPACDLLIGRVVRFHIDESLYHEGRIDPHGLAPVARLAGNDYSLLGHIWTLERPK